MTELKDMIIELKRKHYECEDSWYSCPKSGDCCNAELPNECTCGADKYNKKIDVIIIELLSRLSAGQKAIKLTEQMVTEFQDGMDEKLFYGILNSYLNDFTKKEAE